jgi:hypothetical protein
MNKNDNSLAALRDQVRRLRAEIEELRGFITAQGGPLAPVFPARIDGATFIEQGIVDGEVVDSAGGRACDDAGHETAIIATPADTGFLLAVREAGVDRYLRIGGGSPWMLFRISGIHVGAGGKYKARSVVIDRPDVGDWDYVNPLVTASFGGESTTDDVLALHISETNLNSHDLYPPSTVSFYLGLHIHTNEDGVKVVLFQGVDRENCTVQEV